MRANIEGRSKRAKESMTTVRAPRSRAQTTAKNTAPAPVEMTISGRSCAMIDAERKKLLTPARIIRQGAPSRAWPRATCGTKWVRCVSARVVPSAVSSVTKK